MDVDPVLSALESSGGAALPEDFRPILSAARAVAAVRTALRPAETEHLAARRDALPSFEGLLQQARLIFATEGGLRDDASAALGGIRRRLRSRRTEVSRELERILDARREFVNDPLVVVRNDRYCIPVLASARARVPGIVHDRSGSGQTVFVEPIEIIEPNNELALLAAEERREVERILAVFGRSVLECAPDLRNAVAMLAELDALEARVELGELFEGRIPEISEDGSWVLAGARHPLLDPRLAPLRRKVLGETRAARDAIPLDLELPAATRLLVVSGPNAGGKTVVLKTAGLFCLLAQAGFPVPAAPGTRLPVFAVIRTEIGDAQEILSDKSTFSSSMETLASILEGARGGTLALIDEVGAATDPQEGSALSVAYLEAYLARGGMAIVTTHLSAVKDFAAGRPDALLAAMEYDESSGRPTFRLRPGLSGRSRALAVAREQGVPAEVLERAREILGAAWQRRDASEGAAEELLDRLRRQEKTQAAIFEETERARKRLETERESFEKEKTRILRDGLERFERARRELSRRVDAALEELRRRAPATQTALAEAAGILAEAESEAGDDPLIAQARAEAAQRSASLAAGDSARLRGLQTVGRISSLEGDIAWLEVDGKRVRVGRSELEPAEPQGARGTASRPPSQTPDSRQRRVRPALTSPGELAGEREIAGKRTRSQPDLAAARASVTRSAPASPDATAGEINVIGRRLEEAIGEVDRALDQAILSGSVRLRVIHGHGTGRLRTGLREHLRQHPAVERVRAGDAREGGNGATIVELT